MTKIVDCFPYFNERELLELRIKLLYDVVDKFVIAEGSRTHTGNEKPFSCKRVLAELGLLSDKIEVIEVNLPSKSSVDNNWARENLQRDAAARHICKDTVAIVTDLDEIINPSFVKYYASIALANPQAILRIPMWHLLGRADLHVTVAEDVSAMWTSGFMCLQNHLGKYTLSQIRTAPPPPGWVHRHRSNRQPIEFGDIFATINGNIEMAGWHFTWMGKSERLVQKYCSIADYDDAHPSAVENGRREAVISNLQTYVPTDHGLDPLGRNDQVLRSFNTENLPKMVFEIPSVKSFLFPVD